MPWSRCTTTSAIGALGGAAILSVWRLFFGERRFRRASVVLAIVLAVVIATVAHLGGQLVFLHGVAVRES